MITLIVLLALAYVALYVIFGLICVSATLIVGLIRIAFPVIVIVGVIHFFRYVVNDRAERCE